MRIRNLWRYALLFAVLLFALTACEPDGFPRIASLGGPAVWLDQPPDGANLPLGAFRLKAHARDTSGGVRQITFLVNAVPIGSVDTDPAADLVYAEVTWNASVPGTYLLIASATNAGGTTSVSDPIRVCVGPSCAQTAATSAPAAIGTPTTSAQATATQTSAAQTGCTGKPNVASFTATPTSILAGANVTLRWTVTNANEVAILGTDGSSSGLVPLSGTRNVSPTSTTTFTLVALCGSKENLVEVPVVVTVTVPTATRTRTLTLAPAATATRTRTPTPVPQTGCSGLPVIASFGTPTTINAGGSATLSWGAVTNADSVEINQGIGGVGAPGSTTVSPASTTTYTMTARCGQNNATRTVTISVTQQQQPPQDTTPPSIANLGGTPNPVFHTTGCSSFTLTVTVNVSDASGVSSVTLNYAFANANGTALSSPFTRAMNSVGGNNYSTTINVPSESGQFLGSQTFGRVNFTVSAVDNSTNNATSGSTFVQTQLCIP